MNDIFILDEKDSEKTEPKVTVSQHEDFHYQVGKAPETEPLGSKTQSSPEPQPFEDGTAQLFETWNQPTEVPKDHFASEEPEPDDEPEEEPEVEETEVEDDELGLDAESLDIISEAVVQSNDEGAKWLINWMNGPDADPFPGAGPDKLSVLQKAWRGILLRIKYKPSGWDALLAAEWNAYGWHLMAAMFSFIGRWFKGLVRFPWQAAKTVRRAVKREPETTTVEDQEVVLKASDFTKQNSESQKPDSSSEPLRFCLETNKPIKGEGFPKSSTKHPELIGKFVNSGAFRAYCNRQGLSGPKAKKND